MSGQVLLAVDGPIATITISRPEKLNALDRDMLKALASRCDEVEASLDIRAVILTGAGNAFSAGGDITAWGAMGTQEFGHEWVRFGHRVFDRLADLRMPVIAAMNGHALGGGLELAACADIRIAESQIKIGMPETSLAMVPGWSGTQRLVRRIGGQNVRRMVLAGEVFSAVEAANLGIVDQLAAKGGSAAKAREMALAIALRGPGALEISKLMIAVAQGEDKGSSLEALGSMLAAKTGDMAEGVAAFKGKRAAIFKGGI